jgi:hypothetical protein
MRKTLIGFVAACCAVWRLHAQEVTGELFLQKIIAKDACALYLNDGSLWKAADTTNEKLSLWKVGDELLFSIEQSWINKDRTVFMNKRTEDVLEVFLEKIPSREDVHKGRCSAIVYVNAFTHTLSLNTGAVFNLYSGDHAIFEKWNLEDPILIADCHIRFSDYSYIIYNLATKEFVFAELDKSI